MSAGGETERKVGQGGRCPVCGKPAELAHRPFCSDRCRKVDLNRWLSESYRIPAAEPGQFGDDPGDGDPGGENQSKSED